MPRPPRSPWPTRPSETGLTTTASIGFDHADTNGDGYDDAIVGVGGSVNRAWLMLGRASPAAFFSLGKGDAIISAASNPLTGRLGADIVDVPDRDGDGDDELLVSVAAGTSTAGVYELDGPISGSVDLATAPARYLFTDGRADPVMAVGDLSGDGSFAWAATGGGSQGSMRVSDVTPGPHAMTDTLWYCHRPR